MERKSYIGPRFGPMQALLFLLCGGGWGVSLSVQISLSIVMNEIHDEWHTSYSETSVVAIATMFGQFMGAYVWGVMADRYGRMSAFKKCMFLVSAGCLGSAFVNNVWLLSLCFLVAGFGVGGSVTVDGTVFLEYISIDKAYLLTGMSALMALGGTLAPGLAWMFNEADTGTMWRQLQLTLAGLAAVVGIPRIFIKETPHYLYCRENGSIVASALPITSRFSAISRAEKMSSISDEGGDLGKKTIRQQLFALFRKPLRMLVVAFMIIWMCCSFALTSINVFIPALMDRVGVGFDPAEIYQNMFYQQGAGVPGAVLAGYLVNSCFGRKWTFVASIAIGVVLLFGFLVADYTFVSDK